ncbi:MAG TPA: family 16 glycoside hydrolase [Bryobacteraceae bacterium]|jgi:hypothetical protein|nr:family 16 glycoside hydrolase [Bryobacteraceae bacterium]
MPELSWMKRGLCIALVACAAGLLARSQQNLTTSVVIDAHAPGRTFDGIGALSAGASSRLLIDYPERRRSQILDYLFKPAYGAALQHLKVEVGADVNSTDGSEPSHMRSRTDHNYTRGYEWWLMQEAVKRNPEIILDILPWGAPGWVGNGKLYSRDMAEYMADFIEGAKKHYGLHIRYTGIWNEKEYDSEYVKELKRVLKEHRLDTKIVCCDDYYGEHQWRIAEEMRDDAELRAAVDVIGVHYPQTQDGTLTTTHAARVSDKPLWSSEDQPNPGGGPFLSRDWNPGGKVLATVYNRNYVEGGMTKTEIWSPITSYYDNLAAPNSGLMYANTPWSGYYNVQSTIWVTAHTTQFAQPGWQYLDPACGHLPDRGTFVTLRSPGAKDWSFIAETIGAHHAQTLELKVQGDLKSGVVHVWETNAARTFEHVKDLKASNGVVSIALEPDSLYSLTTTTGQSKGTAQPPANTPFPLPYKDDFEKTTPERAAKYLADQDGAFEAHTCRERAGQCMEQVITERPIPWGPLPDPFTLAGDANWSDYTVRVDAFLDSAADATLMGRIESADVFEDGHARWPSGYVLELDHDGGWQLFSAKFKQAPQTLASGRLGHSAAGWHTVRLTFRGTTISAALDGQQLAKIEDKNHAHGMIAFGCDWGRAQFDNLSIEP